MSASLAIRHSSFAIHAQSSFIDFNCIGSGSNIILAA